MDVTIDTVSAEIQRSTDKPQRRAPQQTQEPHTSETERRELSFTSRPERIRARLITF